jgi:hypothetical protein
MFYRIHRLAKRLSLPRFEYVYVFACLERPWSAKVGFSDNWKARKRTVQMSMSDAHGLPLTLICLVALPVLFARPLEQLVHRNLPKCWFYKRDYGVRGDGATEWYRFINFGACGLVLLILSLCGVQGGGWWCLALLPFVAPLPFDFVLIVAGVCAVQYGALVSGLYLLTKFVILA